jgi:hypothetical protein
MTEIKVSDDLTLKIYPEMKSVRLHNLITRSITVLISDEIKPMILALMQGYNELTGTKIELDKLTETKQ